MANPAFRAQSVSETERSPNLNSVNQGTKESGFRRKSGEKRLMRQGQQNRRGRGRGRKPQNPMSRSYESNGPDVKVRGTAAHVAEKYMSLARDALSSGDIVAAESYLQHAEHYNRIVMAAQAQASQQNAQAADQANGGGGRSRQNPESSGGENPEPEAADAGTGSQDRQRHAGDREHHGGRGRGRQNENRNENRNEGVNDANGAEPEKAKADEDSETVSDPAS